MGKASQVVASGDTAAAEAPADFELAIDEFCARKSTTDRRVELIGAFHAQEVAAGRIKARAAAFEARFVAFEQMPV